MYTIIYPPTIDFYWLYQRPQQLFKYLCRKGDYRVIFYNNEAYLKQSEPVQEVESNYYVCTVKARPKVEMLEEPPILWISYPPHVKYVGLFGEQLVVFDAIDDATEEFAHWRNNISEMVKVADVIFATSKRLYEEYKLKHSKVFLCPNGADYDHFVQGNDRYRPRDLPDGHKPIIGYVGAIAPWLDWKLIESAVCRCRHWDFVFIGPMYSEFTSMIKADNIYYLGRKPYDLLPAYINRFDVCIIPFRKSVMTDAVNPVKLYEYFSAGKPVVATNIYELSDMPLVSLAFNDDEFIEKIEEQLKTDNEEKRRKRQCFAKENSWAKRADAVNQVLSALMEVKRR